jgi:polysaccharide deacetylase family protein (PEP-CTERM system associated)
MTSPHHLLTVAVEDYFQTAGLAPWIGVDRWSRLESRVEVGTRRTLDLLDEFGIRATFFVLGWVAERAPELVREISARGHEIASKGYLPRYFRTMSRDEFREDLLRTRDALERATGLAVLGHRVARGHMGPEDAWALELLAREGFRYDSSFFPRGASLLREPWRRFPHSLELDGRTFWEMPLSSAGPRFAMVPIAGGNYMRQLPFPVHAWLLARWQRKYDAPFNLYFNVWELDPELPRVSAADWLARMRQYRNLGDLPERLRRYFSRYRFQPIREHLKLANEPAREAQAGQAAVVTAAESDAPAEDVTVIVPCYNEEQTLSYLVNVLGAVKAELLPRWRLRFLFVDDASRDGTAAALEKVVASRDDSVLIRHRENRGVAAAILTGIRNATTSVVASIDCDCTYDPAQLGQLLPRLTGDVAMVTASPYHRDGAVRGVPGWRLFLSRGLSLLYRLTTEQRFATYTSCFRVYRRERVADVEIEDGGFLGIAETLVRLDRRGERIVEQPARLEVRLFGESKMRTASTILGHLRLLASLGPARGARRPLAP